MPVILLPRTKSVVNDIELVRKAIPFMYFDAKNTKYLQLTMENYTKEWNERLGVFNDRPLHNCFIAGTGVLTSEGVKPIEEVGVGDMVFDAYGVTHPVEQLHTTYTDTLIKLTLSDGEVIYCTPEHELFLHDVKKVKACYIKEGDTLLTTTVTTKTKRFREILMRLFGKRVQDQRYVVRGARKKITVLKHEILELKEPVKVYDIGVNDVKHQYTLSNGVVVSNSWSHPADAIRYMVVAAYHKIKPKGSVKVDKKRKVSNVVDGLAL